MFLLCKRSSIMKKIYNKDIFQSLTRQDAQALNRSMHVLSFKKSTVKLNVIHRLLLLFKIIQKVQMLSRTKVKINMFILRPISKCFTHPLPTHNNFSSYFTQNFPHMF